MRCPDCNRIMMPDGESELLEKEWYNCECGARWCYHDSKAIFSSPRWERLKKGETEEERHKRFDEELENYRRNNPRIKHIRPVQCGYALESIRVGEDGRVVLSVTNTPEDAPPTPLVGSFKAETDIKVGELVAITKDGTIIGKSQISTIAMRKGDILSINWDYMQNDAQKEEEESKEEESKARIKGMVERL